MEIYRKDIKVQPNDNDNVDRIRVTVDYEKETYRFGRGYIMHVQPMKVEERNGLVCESFSPFDGKGWFLCNAARKSLKADAEAIRIAESVMANCVNEIANKSALTVKEDVA